MYNGFKTVAIPVRFVKPNYCEPIAVQIYVGPTFKKIIKLKLFISKLLKIVASTTVKHNL